MKRLKNTILIISAVIITLMLGFVVYYLAVTANVKLDENKLKNTTGCVTFYDINGEIIDKEVNGNEFVSIDDVPEHVKKAFISIEDKRFYKHNGIDVKRLFGAAVKNVKSFSFKEGASTITQQRIKNTHLSNEKTIKRKFSEIKLAKQLEKKFNKDKILETYLNHIYFGENCYGIACASKQYFDKDVEDLSVNEGAALAAVIKAPSYYAPNVDTEKCNARKNLVLEKMYEQDYISKSELEKLTLEDVVCLSSGNSSDNENYVKMVKSEFVNKTKFTPYKSYECSVRTYYDKGIQNIVEKAMGTIDVDCEKTVILINKKGNIVSYYSTDNDRKRQIGSTIKPLVCYAPAIEENVVDEFSKIIDEKTDFNGYSPSNYNDVYNGKITVKDALAKSSNVCAVKLLNYLTIDKAVNYLNKFNFSLSENDLGLSLALGATEYGEKLLNVTEAYLTFINNGSFNKATTISSVNCFNEVVYTNSEQQTKVFSDDTVSIMNDMLRFSVKNGTAKKLSFLDFPVYAKTGTVGNDKGNTDAYVISYNADYVMGIRLSSKDGKILDNSITGGTLPTLKAKEIWNNIYLNKSAPNEIELSSSVVKIDVDKISYEENDVIELADDVSPNRYKMSVYVKKSRAPLLKSNRFSCPKIEEPKISINNNEINVQLCLTEYVSVTVYKELNNEKIKVYDSALDKSSVYVEKNVLPNKKYKYYVVPYFVDVNGITHFGKEIELETIKMPSSTLGENWWIDNL